MDTLTQKSEPTASPLERTAARVWRLLRSPQLTGGLLLILALLFWVRLMIPQQPSPETSLENWLALLSPAWQAQGALLYQLGLSRLFYSAWFWLPVAGLLLNSAIALADYTPLCYRRTAPTPADITWQHPLAHRLEETVRLPAHPYQLLDDLKKKLEGAGFVVDETEAGEERVVSAARQRWAWWAVVGFYSGVVLLCGAFLLSRYTLATESLTLFPFELAQSRLFAGTLEIHDLDAGGQRGILIYDPAQTEQPARALFWRLYLPRWFKNAWLLPTAIEPVLTIEARTPTGQMRRLMPVQVELSPATRLNLPLSQVEEPLYFLIPSASLSFQIAPVEEGYNVQVRRGAEAAPSENLMIESGDVFTVDDLTMTVSLNHSLSLAMRRDWGWPFYLLSGLVLLGSAAVLLLRPPWQLWLIAEVKGRGGQLYGVLEKFGPQGEAEAFLEALLVEDHPLEGEQAPENEEL